MQRKQAQLHIFWNRDTHFFSWLTINSQMQIGNLGALLWKSKVLLDDLIITFAFINRFCSWSVCTYRLDAICVKELQSLEIVEIYWTHFAGFSQNLLILHEMQQESESMCAKLTARIGAWYEWQGWLFHVYRLLITFVYSDEGMSWNIECCFSLLFKTRLYKKKKNIHSGSCAPAG